MATNISPPSDFTQVSFFSDQTFNQLNPHHELHDLVPGDPRREHLCNWQSGRKHTGRNPGGLLEAGVFIGDVKASSLTVATGSRMRGKVGFGSDERGAGVVLPISGPPTFIRLYPPSAPVSVGSSHSRYQPGTCQESSLREGPVQLGGHFRLLIHLSF